MSYVLYNQNLIPRAQAMVDIEDRGYQFGDGVYEVIRIIESKILFMNEHLQRLKISANKLQLRLPYPLQILKEKLKDLYYRHSIKNGIIYVQITRGMAPRIHHFPSQDVPPQLVAYIKKVERPIDFQKQGVTTVLADDIRWLRCDIKSLNLLGNVLVKQKAKAQNCFESILHRGNIVTEGSTSNVFIVEGDELYTHPATNLILNGITRQKVLELCQDLKLKVEEKPFSVEQLLKANEVFLTGSICDIMPVIKINGQKIGDGTPGAITQRLQEAFFKLIH